MDLKRAVRQLNRSESYSERHGVASSNSGAATLTATTYVPNRNPTSILAVFTPDSRGEENI